MAFSATEDDQDSEIEQFVEQTILSEANIHTILATIESKFFPLTKQELKLWEKDCLKFFIQQKEQSNEVKGNYLRERAALVIGGLKIRCEQHFRSYFN